MLGMDKTTSAVVVLVLVFILAYTIAPKLYASIAPFTGISKQTAQPGRIKAFDKSDIIDALELSYIEEVRLELNTELSNVRMSKEAEDPGLQPMGILTYKLFRMTFEYEDERGFSAIPDDYIDNILVTFKLPAWWLNDNLIEKDDVLLGVWHDRSHSWINNTAYFKNTKAGYRYYTASSSYHGSFGIFVVLE